MLSILVKGVTVERPERAPPLVTRMLEVHHQVTVERVHISVTPALLDWRADGHKLVRRQDLPIGSHHVGHGL